MTPPWRKSAAGTSAATGCGTSFPSCRAWASAPPPSTTASQAAADQYLEQAKDYFAHPVLGPRLVEISRALLELPGSDPTAVMGYPDDLKLCSCMTLFELAAPDEPVFGRVLEKYYGGRRDRMTLNLLSR